MEETAITYGDHTTAGGSSFLLVVHVVARPLRRSDSSNLLAIFVQLSLLDHLLLLLRLGTKTPLSKHKTGYQPSQNDSKWYEEKITHPSWVEITVHDASLDLGDNTVVTGREVDSRHHGDTDSNGFTLGGHENNLLVDLNVSLCGRVE
jgi:hypothetical protein